MIDYADLCDQLGLETEESGNDELRGPCPFHDDSHPSWYINRASGLWFCQSGCGGGNVTSLVQKSLGLTYVAAASYVADWHAGRALTPADQVALVEKLKMMPTAERTELETFMPDPRLTPLVMPLWFVDRGFSEVDWQRFGLTYDKSGGDVCIPVMQDGRQVGEIRRRAPGFLPKYLYSHGFPRARVLYGEDRLRDPAVIYVVEGALDCIWMWNAGFPTVAMLGSHLSEVQVRRLASWNVPLILAFDNDAAGESATRRALVLVAGAEVSVLSWPEWAKDPQDIKDIEMLRAVVTGRGVQSWYEWMQSHPKEQRSMSNA